MSAKKKAAKTRKKTAAKTAVIRQPHGGALLAGGVPGNAGGGRPQDEVKAKLRDLGLKKSIPFISKVLDGKITVSLIGKCDACEHEQPISEDLLGHIMDRISTSIDQQIKVSEQTLKYGKLEKQTELVITSGNAYDFFECVQKAIEETCGSDIGDVVKARAVELMEAKK